MDRGWAIALSELKWSSSSWLEHPDLDACDDIFHVFTKLLHVRRGQMGAEGSRVLPLFYDRNHVRPAGWLTIYGILQINSGSILNATFLGEDLRDKRSD
jgi:hypothetical protein